MDRPVRLVFGVHSHQPIGNFDEVFARALHQAYDPFLDALERHPGVRAVLHYSGCLCEWLDRRASAHLDRIGALARSGRIELLTGGYYEPILPLIPRADRVGQIRLQTRFIKERFGVEARGLWLAERVWEPTLPRTLREAGVEYTLLDDYHFLSALEADPVGGHYITEDQGDPVKLFPISEQLRYLIPFREPAETVAWLARLARTAPEGAEPVAVIVDDGEKFGLWPGTHAWVHGEAGRAGWLESFFTLLEQNASWLTTTTLERAAAEVEPRGRVYLPPGSYFEMGEWSLPPGRGREFHALGESSRARGAWDTERSFLRGGYFRNFQAKYPESLLMVRRAQMLSKLLDADTGQAAADREGRPSEARRELWRAMCNCSYWHGIFGGLYLPHIRRAVGEHLCRARRLHEAARGAGLHAPQATAGFLDVDADGHPDVEIETPDLTLLVEPERGGAITVMDLRRKDFPLGLTLTRRIENYHQEMLEAGEIAGGPDHGSIHEIAAGAGEELKRLVVADDRQRASAVDRFLAAGARVEDLEAGRPVERGDFFKGRYEVALIRQGEAAGAALTRRGAAMGSPVTVAKTIRALAGAPRLELRYRLQGADTAMLQGARFAVEMNFALIESMGRVVIAGGAGEGAAFPLSATREAGPAPRLRVEDDYAGFAIALSVEPAARVWHHPVRTVSRSEKGYEAIYQGSALLLVWDDLPGTGGEASVDLEIV